MRYWRTYIGMAGEDLRSLREPLDPVLETEKMALECQVVIKWPLKTVFLSFGGS